MAIPQPYNPRTKYYIRLDASGNPIAGTNIARLKMPKTGSWRQIDGNTCCFPYTELTFTPEAVDDASYTISLLCDASPALVIITPATTAADVQATVDYLNENFSFLGLFLVASSTTATIKLKQELADSLCDGTMTITVLAT